MEVLNTTVDYLANNTAQYASQAKDTLCQTNTFGTIGQTISNGLRPLSGLYNKAIDSVFPQSWKIWLLVVLAFGISYFLTQKFKPSKGMLIILIAAVLYMFLRAAGFGG